MNVGLGGLCAKIRLDIQSWLLFLQGRSLPSWSIIDVALWSPISKIILAVVQDLASLTGLGKAGTSIAWNHWRVVKKSQEPTSVLGENDLLLCSFDCGKKLGVIGFLELLTGLVRLLAAIAEKLYLVVRNCARVLTMLVS